MSQAGALPSAAGIAAAPKPLLTIRGVETFYGKIQALKGIDIDVNQGEIVTLIGANGAGKSTTMMTVFGSPRARKGSIVFDRHDITNMATHQIARLSIAQSPEGRRIFPRMTVYENLQMGASIDNFAHFDEDLERAFVMFPRLKERSQQRGGTLSGGEQQMLAIARALLGNPSVLLMDEPSEGLAPIVVEQMVHAMRALADDGSLSILLVEQRIDVALDLAARYLIMDRGRVVYSGPTADLRMRPEQLPQMMGLES